MNRETDQINKIDKYASGKTLVYAAAVLSGILIALTLIPFGEGGVHWSLAFFGRLHPLLVHLPIGILLGLFAFEILQYFRPSLQLQTACGILLWLAVLTAVPTVLAGKMLAASGEYGSSVFTTHMWFGLATTLLNIWLLVLYKNTSLKKTGKLSPYHGLLFVNVALLSFTGHYGGSLTHGSNYLTENLPDEVRAFFGDDPYAMDGLLAMEASQVNETLKNFNFANDIRPITETYCVGCHGEEKQKGGLRLDEIDPDLVHGKDAETWRAMLDMVNSAEMPPEDEKQLTDEERRVLVDWITASIQQAVEIRKSEQKPVIRRLTKNQYTHTLNNLLNLSVDFGEVLPDDGKSEMGFSNNGQVQQISPLHIEYYKKLAREALDKAIGPAEKPRSTRYKITFGKGIGRDKPAAMIGGYQSAPINSDDFIVEILDEKGRPKKALDSLGEARLNEIKMNIGIGMRGSTADRYEVVEEGIILYSALPHKEVTPKSWQGPSPNLKLLIRDHYPTEGHFEFRVKAARGYQWYTQKAGFISLRDNLPAEKSDGAIILQAADCQQKQNLKLLNNQLVPKEVTAGSNARYTFDAPWNGYYQIDFIHPYVREDAMPSVRLRVDRHRLEERLHLNKALEKEKELVTPLTLAYLEEGAHTLEIGGPFFTGFNRVVVTPFPDDHPLAIQLSRENEESRKKYDQDTPVIRTFAGARTDDGMDYKTFDDFKNVTAKLGEPEQYIFKGRLENLPIPAIDTVDTEILANIMIIGLWNDFLVKDNQDSGPPLLIKELEFEAPYHPEWPPESYSSIFFPAPDQEDKEMYTRQVLKQFMERAYRRPLVKGETDRYMEFWQSIKDDYTRYEDGVKEVLIAILCSPNFIYLAEPEEDASDDRQQFYLAARLSYFLWNSPPDEELYNLAKKGRLHRKKELKKQVKRMLQDDRSWHMIQTFSKEWLRVDRHESMSTNVNEYETFTRFVKQDMTRETYHFINHVLQEDLSIHNLIDSEFALLNQNLAEFYGIDSVKGNHFRPVKVRADMHRGGLLSQGAFLSGHSDGTQAHAIKRAVWLQSKILGDHPPDPPPNVPELDPETPGFEHLTLKEQLFLHRDKASCMDCHRKIDPYGIAFENYNAVGVFQTMANQKPIDAKAELPDGKVVNGIDEIKSYIINDKSDDFTRSLVKHLFAYAMGRDVTFVDEKEIEAIVRDVKSDGYRFQAVFENIVTSRSFRGEF